MEQNKYYCECPNPNCGNCYMIMIPDDPCSECGTKVKIQQVEEW